MFSRDYQTLQCVFFYKYTKGNNLKQVQTWRTYKTMKMLAMNKFSKTCILISKIFGFEFFILFLNLAAYVLISLLFWIIPTDLESLIELSKISFLSPGTGTIWLKHVVISIFRWQLNLLAGLKAFLCPEHIKYPEEYWVYIKFSKEIRSCYHLRMVRKFLLCVL